MLRTNRLENIVINPADWEVVSTTWSTDYQSQKDQPDVQVTFLLDARQVSKQILKYSRYKNYTSKYLFGVSQHNVAGHWLDLCQ